MPGTEEITSPLTPVFGPRKLTRLDAMGIRFMADGDGAGEGAGGGDYTPPATQADLDRIITDRLARATAKVEAKFEGFDDFKAKAEKFDAIKDTPVADAAALAKFADLESRVTEATTRATTAEQAAAAIATENARLAVATDKGLAKEHLALLTATTREALEVQADAILKLTSGSGRVPGQGGRDANAAGGSVSAGRELFETSRKKSTS